MISQITFASPDGGHDSPDEMHVLRNVGILHHLHLLQTGGPLSRGKVCTTLNFNGALVATSHLTGALQTPLLDVEDVAEVL